jgi:DNA-binding FadR family transcriptional regulator
VASPTTALAAHDPDWAESVMRSHIPAAWHSIHATEPDAAD